MTAPDPMAEIRASFFIECEELLEAMQDGLQNLDDGDDDPETINIVFRAVHSIKGGAGAFGLEKLVHFAHRFETVLDGVRAGTLAVSSDLTKLFFRAGDHLSDIVRAYRDDTDFAEADGKVILDELGTYDASAEEPEQEEDIDFQPMMLSLDLDLDAPGDDAAEPSTPQWRVVFTPDTEMYESGNEVFPILSALRELGEATITCDTSKVPLLQELAPESAYLSWTVDLTTPVSEAEIRSTFEFVDGLCKLSIEPLKDPPLDDTATSDVAPVACPAAGETAPVAAPQAPVDKAADVEPQPNPPGPTRNSAPNPAKSVVRVDIDRIERLVNLVGELVINQAMLAQSLESAGLSPHSDAMNGLEEFQRLTRDIQDSVMMIRAQPVKPLFQRMSRIVREASAAVDKDVRLETTGDSTEVDKTVIERLADPLTHMIRNAVDHGLETSEERIAAGKPQAGVVRLSAAHRSGRVVIEVADDGGGIDRAKVQQIAIDKGLIPPDAVLSETEIDNLLFLPGFSTASSVSNLSGRGVGMDVVKTAIQSLGGRITITSVPGSGTTFSISLPHTLAVLDGMVVNVAGETLVVPLSIVAESLTIHDGNTDEIEPGAHVVRVRGGFVPLFDLGRALGYRTGPVQLEGSVALLIAQEDGNRAALIVDDIQDQRQVVIKGLDEAFCRAPGIAAATILGDGQIALIIDPSDIIAHAPQDADIQSTPMRMEA